MPLHVPHALTSARKAEDFIGGLLREASTDELSTLTEAPGLTSFVDIELQRRQAEGVTSSTLPAPTSDAAPNPPPVVTNWRSDFALGGSPLPAAVDARGMGTPASQRLNLSPQAEIDPVVAIAQGNLSSIPPAPPLREPRPLVPAEAVPDLGVAPAQPEAVPDLKAQGPTWSPIARQLRLDEGDRLDAYFDDSKPPKLTVGIGHLVQKGDNLKFGDVITAQRKEQLFAKDFDIATRGAKRLLKGTGSHPPEVQDIILQMSLQMGVTGTGKFIELFKALKKQDYNAAADAMLDSDWANVDTPARAKRLADEMRALATPSKTMLPAIPPPHERPREKPTMLPAIDEAAPDEAAPYEKFKGQLRLKAGPLGFAVNAPPASYIESPLPLDAVSFEAPKVPSQLGAVPALMESAPRTVDHLGYPIDLTRPIIQGADGQFHTELGISVNDSRLNDGQPTVIPSIVNGEIVELNLAIKDAVERQNAGESFPAFPTHDEATAYSKQRSSRIDQLRQPGTAVNPSTINEPSAAQLLPNAPGPGQLHEPAVQTPPVARAVASADPSLPEAWPRVAPQLPGGDGDLGYLLDSPDKAPKTESEILKFLKRPETTAALLQFAINVLQPLAPGQSTIGAIASALGAGGKAYGRVVDKRAAAEKGAREEARDQQVIDIDDRDKAGSARIEESKFKATQQKAANDLYESLQSAGLEALSYSMEDVTPAAREALARRSAQQVAKMYPGFGYEPIINDQSTLGLLYNDGRLLSTLQNPKSREALLARLDVDEDILAAFLAEMGLVDPSLPTSSGLPSGVTTVEAVIAAGAPPTQADDKKSRQDRVDAIVDALEGQEFKDFSLDQWRQILKSEHRISRDALRKFLPKNEFDRVLAGTVVDTRRDKAFTAGEE